MPNFDIKFKVYFWDLRCDDGNIFCFLCYFAIANVNFMGIDTICVILV